MADTPIPAGIWKRIQSFLRDGHTGQIVINVHRGSVANASISERIGDDAHAEPVVKST